MFNLCVGDYRSQQIRKGGCVMKMYNFDAGPGEPVCTPGPAAPPTTPDPANDAPVPDHSTPESDTAPEPADGDPAPAQDTEQSCDDEATQPASKPKVIRAGWFSVSHDDLGTVLAASSGTSGLRNLAVWIHLLRSANRKQSLEFDVSCDVIGADLRGIDRRTVRAALEVLRDCGLLSMSDPEKSSSTGYFLPTTVCICPTCSPVRDRVQKTRTDNASPCTKKVQGDSDTVSPAILRASSKEDSSKRSSLEKTVKRKTKDYSNRGSAHAGSDGPPLRGVRPRSASAWNSKKKTATALTQTETAQLKANIL